MSKKGLCKRLLSIVLCTLLLTEGPLAAHANDSGANDNKIIDNVVGDRNNKKQPNIICEDKSKREANVKYFLNDDKSYTAVVYSDPVHYKVNGKYEDIDNSLVSDNDLDNTVLKNKANDFNVKFSKKSNTNKLVDISTNNYNISWRIKDSSVVELKQESAESGMQLSANEEKINLEYINSTVSYKGILPDIDFNYSISSRNLKENIVLNNKNAQNIISFNINVGKLEAVLCDDRTVSIVDPNTKEAVFSFAAPYMVDSKFDTSNKIDVKLVKSSNTYTYTLTANKDWLDDNERAFPVIIDPIVRTLADVSGIEDTFIDDSEMYSQNYDYLSVGNNMFFTRRSLLKFDLPDDIDVSDKIVDADLKLFKYSQPYNTGNFYLDVHEITEPWNVNSVNWSNQPAINDKITDYAPVSEGLGADSWDITKLVDKWNKTPSDNNGVMLKYHTEWFIEPLFFCSSEGPGDTCPYISITYRNAKGLESYWDTNNNSLGRAGISYINNFNGNLVFENAGPNTDGIRMSADISFIYNGYLANKKFCSINSKTTAFTNMNVGLGFKLNIQETIVPTSAEMSSNAYLYIYTDPDGTEHYFELVEGILKDEDGLGLELIYDAATGWTMKDGDITKQFNTAGNLISITDGNGNAETITYDANGRITAVTDGSGEQLVLGYNANNYLTTITDPYNRVTTYGYDTNNRLTSITYPDSEVVNFTYNTDGTLATAEDITGQKLSYQYASKSVSSVKEIGSSGTDGQQTNIEYDICQTTFTAAGEDGVFGNNFGINDDILTVYQFDNMARTTCVYVTNADGSDTFQSLSYIYADDKYNGEVSVSSSSKPVNNLLKNHSAELTGNDWTASGTASIVTSSPFVGSHSFYVNSTSASSGRVTYKQTVNIDKGSAYTYSGYVKSADISTGDSCGASLMVTYKDANGQDVIADSKFITGTSDYSRASLTFTVPADSTQSTADVFISLKDASGDAYFDALQLEKGDTVSQYNMLEDSSFERGISAGYWNAVNLSSGDGLSATSFDGEYSYKIVGDEQTDKGLYQDIYVNKNETTTYTLSGWAKADSVDTANDKATFRAAITTPLSIPIKTVYIDLNKNVSGWQYFSKTFSLDDEDEENEDVTTIRVNLCYYKNANEVMFDNLQLVQSSEPIVLNEDNEDEVTQTDTSVSDAADVRYDQYGNQISSQLGKSVIAYYSFDNQTLSDSSNNHYNGTNHGATFVDGRVGKALHFDGVDDYADLGLFDVPDNFSISMWAKPETTKWGQLLLGKHTSTGSNQLLFAYFSNLELDLGSGYIRDPIKSLGYQHFVLSFEKLNNSKTRVRIYRDARLLREMELNSVLGDTSTGKPWVIGQDWDGENTLSDFFQGDIDEVTFFNGVLSDDEINKIYGLTMDKGLVAKYSFDSDTGTTVKDSSGNGYNGTLVNGGTFSSGYIGNAVNLDGTNDYIQLPDFNLGQSFTVSMWLKPDTSASMSYFSKNYTNKSNMLNFGCYTSNKFCMQVRTDTKYSGSRWSGAYGHLAATVEKISDTQSTVTFYKDGVIVGTSILNSVVEYTDTLAWCIGQEWDPSGESDFFDGQIDEVSFYNYALSSEEVITLNTYGTLDTLIAKYTFDNDSGTTIKDSTPNGYDAKLINGGGFSTVSHSGKAVVLDGTDDYIQLPDLKLGSSFSISMWLRPDTTSNMAYFSKNTTSYGNTFLLGNYSSKQYVNLSDTILYGGAAWSGSYAHVVATVEKISSTQSQITVYKNASVVFTTTFSKVMDYTNTLAWCIGQEWDTGGKSDFFDGYIDEVNIYNYALDINKVKSLYTSNTEKARVVRYTFNSDTGTTITDSSGYGYHATAIGGCTFSAGHNGNAVNMDGADDYIQMPNVNVGTDFSVSMWVKPTTSTYDAYFSKHTSTGSNIFILGSYINGVYVNIKDATHSDGTRWKDIYSHIVSTVKAVGTDASKVYVYRDNVLLFETTLNKRVTYTNARAWCIGQEWDGSTLSDLFDGQIDEFELYNYPLNKYEIENLFYGRAVNSLASQTLNMSDYAQSISTSATYSNGTNIIGDRVETETDERGKITSYSYDSYGQVSSITDPKGNIIRYIRNSRNGELQQIYLDNNKNGVCESAMEPSTSYTYYNGFLTAISTNGFDYNFTYDQYGNTESISVGSQALISYAYKAKNGSLESATYGNGDEISYEYDVMGRVTKTLYNDTGAFEYVYNNSGNLARLIDLVNDVTYEYSYDFEESLIKISGSNGHDIIMNRDSSGSFNGYTNVINGVSSTVEYTDNGVKINGTQRTSQTYDNFDRLSTSKLHLGSEYVTRYTYLNGINAAQTTSLIETMQNGSNTLKYTYDNNGNIETISEKVGTGSYTQKVKYYYDGLNQLIREDNLYINKTVTYEYDLAGNLKYRREFVYTTGIPSAITDIIPYSYDAVWKDKLAGYDGKAITYDEIGNPLTYDGWTYTWQNGRQLASMSKIGTAINYQYNANGYRTSKTVNGVTTTYYLQDDRVVCETNGTDTIWYYYDESNNLIGFNLNGDVNEYYYYVRNAQGDIIEILDKDGGQAVTYTYDSWGKVTGIGGSLATTVGYKNPYLYRGYRYDAETGLFYVGSRYYDPETGRWINSDELRVLTEGQINLFAYCYNNPANYVDPTGYGAVLRAAPVCPSGVLTAIKLTKWNRSYYVDYFSSMWKSGGYQVYSFTSNPSNSHFTIYNFWVRVNSYKGWIKYLEKEYGWIGSLDQWFEDTLDLIGEAGDIIPKTAFISSVISYALSILPSYAPPEMKYILKMLNKYKGNEKTIYIVFFMDQISMSAKRKYWLWGSIVGWNRNLLFSQVKPY